MERKKQREKICLAVLVCIFVSFMLALVIVYWDSTFITVRGDPEGTVSISDEVIVEQEFIFDHTKQLSMELMVTIDENIDKDSESAVIFTIIQDGIMQEYRQPLSSFPCSAWQSVKMRIDSSRFHTGGALIRISGNHLEDHQIAVLLTGGEQKNRMEFARVNGEECVGQYLAFSYNHYNYQGFFKIWVLVASLCVVLALCLKGLSKLYKKYPMTANTTVIAVFFVLRFHLFGNYKIDEWVKLTWLSDYRYGIVNRGFFATIFTFILNIVYKDDCVTDIFLKNAAIILTAIILALVIRWIWMMEKNMQEDIRDIGQKILMVWICSPWFFTFFMTQGTIGRLDIILMAIFLICCELIFKQKLLWVIPILCVCGVLTYEVFTLIYFPTIFLLLLEISYFNKKKENWITTAVTTVSVLSITVYIHFFGTLIGKADINEYYQNLTERIGEKMEYSKVICYPFGIAVGGMDISMYHLLCRLVLLLLVVSPILLFFSLIWMLACKKTEDKYAVVIYMLFLVSPFSMLFLMNASDFMRYFVGIYTSLINGLLVSVQMKKNEIADAWKQADNVFKEKFGYQYLAMALMIFMMLGIRYETCWPYTEVTNTIVDGITDISEWIKGN
jgi:hypothetical protein